MIIVKICNKIDRRISRMKLSRIEKTMLYAILHINELIEKGFLQEDVYKDTYPVLERKRETKRQLKNFSPTEVELLEVLDYLLDWDNASNQTKKVLGDMGVT